MFNQESVLKPCLNIFAFPCNGEMSLRFGLQASATNLYFHNESIYSFEALDLHFNWNTMPFAKCN